MKNLLKILNKCFNKKNIKSILIFQILLIIFILPTLLRISTIDYYSVYPIKYLTQSKKYRIQKTKKDYQIKKIKKSNPRMIRLNKIRNKNKNIFNQLKSQKFKQLIYRKLICNYKRIRLKKIQRPEFQKRMHKRIKTKT